MFIHVYMSTNKYVYMQTQKYMHGYAHTYMSADISTHRCMCLYIINVYISTRMICIAMYR